jgi:hypothetical protein
MRAAKTFFTLIIAFSMLILYLNFKKSGADIFVNIMVVLFSIAAILINTILALILKYNIKTSTMGILAGAIISVLIVSIVISLT